MAGLPESGLFLFGSITNSTNRPFPPDHSITWKITNGPTVVTVPATVVVVDGQHFHFCRVPFETRSLGPAIIGQTPNTFALTGTASTYTRSAWLGTNACTFVNPAQASFTFSKADRGKVERVDLAVSLPNSEPPPDTDGDGFPDWLELLAGTDPKDRNSFPLSEVGIYPKPSGNGIALAWASTPGATYEIRFTSDLSAGFSTPPFIVIATSNQSTYHDPRPIGPGPLFYRIKLTQSSSP